MLLVFLVFFCRCLRCMPAYALANNMLKTKWKLFSPKILCNFYAVNKRLLLSCTTNGTNIFKRRNIQREKSHENELLLLKCDKFLGIRNIADSSWIIYIIDFFYLPKLNFYIPIWCKQPFEICIEMYLLSNNSNMS